MPAVFYTLDTQDPQVACLSDSTGLHVWVPPEGGQGAAVFRESGQSSEVRTVDPTNDGPVPVQCSNGRDRVQ